MVGPGSIVVLRASKTRYDRPGPIARACGVVDRSSVVVALAAVSWWCLVADSDGVSWVLDGSVDLVWSPPSSFSPAGGGPC